MSLVPVLSKQTTGVPHALASNAVKPKASFFDGITKTSEQEYIFLRNSSLLIFPKL